MRRRTFEFLLCLAGFGALSIWMHVQGRVPWPEAGAARATATWKVDLATAGEAELGLLPGIGPVRSRAIIALRAVHPGLDVQDLAMVSGIGPTTIRRLIESELVRRAVDIQRGP